MAEALACCDHCTHFSTDPIKHTLPCRECARERAQARRERVKAGIRCPDCGAWGEIQGHMECPYPKEA